jgi:phenylacetate-CoA ligase
VNVPALIRAAPQFLLMRRSQYWSPARLDRYVEANLSGSLAAAMRIPFYRQRFEGFPLGDFQGLPTMSRAQVPILASSVRSLHLSRKLVPGNSSGSTGMPVGFFWDARHQASRFAARARYLRENGWNPLARSAWLVSMSPANTDAWLVSRGRLLGARFASHIGDLEQQAEWLRKLNPRYLYAFPVNLDGLARVFETRGWRLASLRRIFSGSEVLEDSVRQRVRRVFGVEVSDNYGSTEAFLAWECPRQNYHINAEHVLLEIVDESGRPAAPGAIGRVLVTTLQNRLMPLVRYEIGDYAIAANGSCPCGRTLPLVGPILGREINLFTDSRGRRFVPWPLFRPLTVREFIKQSQLVQRGVGRFLVRFVADRDLATGDKAEIASHFESVVGGPVTIEFERLVQIPRAPSGKFMMAMSEIAADA